MKIGLNIIGGILFILFTSCQSTKIAFDYNEIEHYQKELKEEFDHPDTTPLKEDERAGFEGIQFFPIDEDYRVQAKFVPTVNGKTYPFPTSAGKIKYYKDYGQLYFNLNNKAHQLTLFQADPPHPDYLTSLFLPFMDETNGETTYGGGRYIDLEISDIKNGKVVVDFNKAYNPYCAYSKYYNCPIPPAQNYLETEIKAGVSYTP